MSTFGPAYDEQIDGGGTWEYRLRPTDALDNA